MHPSSPTQTGQATASAGSRVTTGRITTASAPIAPTLALRLWDNEYVDAVAACLLSFLVFAPHLRLPPTVDSLTVANPTPYDIQVDVGAAGGQEWLSMSAAAIAIGPHWGCFANGRLKAAVRRPGPINLY